MTLSATRTTIPEEARRQGLLAVVIARAVRGGNAIALAAMRWTRAVSGVVTPLGWSVAAAAIAALAVGYGWGLVEVIVLGWAFAVLFAVSALWLVGRGAGEVHLSLPSPRVVVGDHAEARLLASNRGPRRFGGVQLEVPVGARLVERVLPGLPRGGSIEAELHIPTDRRGVVSIGPARTVRADPIGLMRREIVWSETVEMRVQPRTVAVSALSTGFIRDLEGSPTRDLTTSDIAFHALREYLPGDDRRYIHWRSSAKTGTFMVRQFEESRRSRMMVLLDLDPGAYVDDAEFELAVGAAASVGARAIRDARSVAFVVSGHRTGRAGAMRELPTVSRDRLVDALCVVERDDRAAPLPEVARTAAETLHGLSLVFLVTGSARGVAPLRSAASRVPPGIEVVAVQCSPESQPTARTVGGLTVFGIGYLEDLRAMLARSASIA